MTQLIPDGQTAQGPPETPETSGGVLMSLSDRQLLLHISAQLSALLALAEPFRPLLAQLTPGGQAPDMLSAAQAWRAGRKHRRVRGGGGVGGV